MRYTETRFGVSLISGSATSTRTGAFRTSLFTSDNTAVLNYTLDIYPSSADADGDGFPDANAQPILSIPTTDTAKRVPIL